MRTNNTNWDEYFFALAMVCASRSKDPSTVNGAVISDNQNVVRGLGYNGFLRGLQDVPEHWDNRPEKYRRVVHAERNAILNSSGSVKGCKMHIWSSRDYFSCEECATEIIQAGISEVHFIKVAESDTNDWGFNSAKGLFDECKVKVFMHPEIDETVLLDKLGCMRGSSMIQNLRGKCDEWVAQFMVQKIFPLMEYRPDKWGISVTIPDGALLETLTSAEYQAVKDFMKRNHPQCVDFFKG